jgi:hypothetical protein
LLHLTANTACTNSVAKSAAVLHIFPQVILCAAQIQSSNMMHISFFMHIPKNGIHGVWINSTLE